ncbi:MAG TPA: rhomboid family protein [Chthoniobacteraceae bacterium]|jgi:hypothetical protein
MSVVAAQRCLNHPAREAVGRCPECTRTFCRECITEHEGRILCADCLTKLARAPEAKPRRKLPLWPPFQLATGLVTAWLFFYFIGKLLVAIPSSVHEGTLWQTNLWEESAD